MRVEFSAEAQTEFNEARRYYERLVPGLGTRFREEVRHAIVRIRAWPLAAPIARGDIRRMVLPRFPYKLLYSVEQDHLLILAVAHSHRAPDYWVKSG